MEKYSSDELRCKFEALAEWRHDVAVEHPGDARNLDAVKIFERLAETAKDIEPKVLDAYVELFEDASQGERESKLEREVGFYWFPESASEFVARFIGEETGGGS